MREYILNLIEKNQSRTRKISHVYEKYVTSWKCTFSSKIHNNSISKSSNFKMSKLKSKLRMV